MAFNINIPEIKTYFDDLISLLGRACTLYYEPLRSECPNCYFNSHTGRSSGQYKVGGPIEFSNKICPYCQDVGLVFTESSASVTMLVEYNVKEFKTPIPDALVSIKENLILTEFYLTDIPKIQQTKYMSIASLGSNKYELASEPEDTNNIIQGVYAIAYWKRIK